MVLLTSTEAQLQVDKLLDKLERWLVQQNEWLILMGLPERHVRKAVARLVVKELLLMPVRKDENITLGREKRRAIMRELEKSEREWYRGVR